MTSKEGKPKVVCLKTIKIKHDNMVDFTNDLARLLGRMAPSS